MFSTVGVRIAPSVVHILTSHLEVEIDDAEWIISRMKAESAELTDIPSGSTQNEAVEKSVCTRLGHVINACHELLQSALPIGPCVDTLMRVVCRLYLVLTLLVKWSLSLYVRKIGHMSGRFEKLVKLSGTNLTQSVYPMITYVQMSQSEQRRTDVDKGKKKKKNKNKSLVLSSDKTRILKETRSIPNLIYAIEQYEKYLIQLSKKSKVDLMAHFKMSTSRDFRINAASLQAAIERAAATQSDDSEHDDRDAENNNTNDLDESTAPSSKRPRTAESSLPKARNTKGKLSKR
jgi:Fanconi anemia group I protein